MCVCIHGLIYIYTLIHIPLKHVLIHTHSYTYMNMCVCIHICMRVHIFMCVRTYICVRIYRVRESEWRLLQRRQSLCLYTHTYTHSHIHTHYICIPSSRVRGEVVAEECGHHLQISNVCIYVHIYICLYSHIYMHLHIHAYVYIYIPSSRVRGEVVAEEFGRMCVYTLINMNTLIHIHTLINIHTLIHIHSYTYSIHTHIYTLLTHIHIHICTYIYIYTYRIRESEGRWLQRNSGSYIHHTHSHTYSIHTYTHTYTHTYICMYIPSSRVRGEVVAKEFGLIYTYTPTHILYTYIYIHIYTYIYTYVYTEFASQRGGGCRGVRVLRANWHYECPSSACRQSQGSPGMTLLPPLPPLRGLCCSMLQCVAVCCRQSQGSPGTTLLPPLSISNGLCCSKLQCVAVRALHCVAVCRSVLSRKPRNNPSIATSSLAWPVLQRVAACCNVLQCVTLRCSE